MSNGYQVDQGKLSGAGDAVAQHGQRMEQIKAEVRDAEVPTKAWGLLGIELGLYPIYVSMLTDLEEHLHMSQQHIDGIGRAMKDTAQMYQDFEDAISDVFKGIQKETEEFGRSHPELAQGAVADAGGEVSV